MVRYFYEWTPLLFIGAVGLLVLPGLALIAIAFVAIIAVAAVALPVVAISSIAGRAVRDRWQGASDESPGARVVLAPVPSNARPVPRTQGKEP